MKKLDITFKWTCKYLLLFFSVCSIYSQDANSENEKFTSLKEALETPAEVLTLDLTDQGLENLPEEIVRLANLRELHLCENPELALVDAFNLLKEIETLEVLWITDSELTSIPFEISQIKSLKEIWLDGNRLVEIPRGIRHLDVLESLSLFDNELSIIRLEEGELSNLTYVNLCYNKFKTFPTQLTSAKRVIAWYNEIDSIPESISNMPDLQYLNLEHNNLIDIPDELIRLELIELDLGSNNLNDESVAKICQIISLEKLDIEANNLSVIPRDIKKLSNLKKLTISYNDIMKLPRELSVLKNLEQIGLGDMPNLKWTKTFKILEELPMLERVGMFKMGLNTMPSGFKKLNQVKIFWMPFNRFDNDEKNRIIAIHPNAEIGFK